MKSVWIAGLVIATAPIGCPAQSVSWPEKKVRIVDQAAVSMLARDLREQEAKNSAALGESHNQVDDMCLEDIGHATGTLHDEVRQTWSLSDVAANMQNPVDEDVATTQLFDELIDAQKIIKLSRALIMMSQQICANSPRSIISAVGLESLVARYQDQVSILQQRIGPRPGP
jgi:hypothetical protein